MMGPIIHAVFIIFTMMIAKFACRSYSIDEEACHSTMSSLSYASSNTQGLTHNPTEKEGRDLKQALLPSTSDTQDIKEQRSIAAKYAQNHEKEKRQAAIPLYESLFQMMEGKPDNVEQAASIAKTLGASYEGQGNRVKAKEWYEKAKELGHPYAERSLSELESNQ